MNYNNVPSPAFVLDESRLIKNLELLSDVQNRAGVSIILALKGFAMWKVFPLVKTFLSGATASSLNEARLIFEEMGVPAHTYSPAYLPDEVDQLLELSSHLTFNSLGQLDRWGNYMKQRKPDLSPGLRVNPEYSEVETDLYNPAVPGSRLGELAVSLPKELPDLVEGLHVHTLCESNSFALEKLILAVEQKFGRYLPRLKWMNFGGGHLMTRQGYNVEHAIMVLKAFRARHPHLKVILEPGSAIAWETGELVTTVLDIIDSGGIKTAVIDASFTAHMPDTLEMPYRPKILGATDPIAGKPSYRIGGVSCLAGDFMEAYSFDEPLKVGDRIVFWDMIHYTLVKTTMFNGVRHPDICIYRKDDTLEVVRRFEYADFRGRLG